MTTITIKNIPDELYEQLKKSAKTHRRSINSELIQCLEMVLNPVRPSPELHLERFRSIRSRLDAKAIDIDDIQRAIDEVRS